MESKSKLNLAKVARLIKENDLTTTERIIGFLKNNKDNYSFFDLSKIAENANQLRMQNSAYYTDESLLKVIEKELPDFEKNNLSILEPSVGVGNFLPIIFQKYSDKKVTVDVIDIDNESLEILKTLIGFFKLPKNVKINFFNSDFCTWEPKRKYDLAIGNPPFSKIKSDYFDGKKKKYYLNFESTNLASYFYEKCLFCAEIVCMILPKNILNTPEYKKTRDYLKTKNIQTILDFGENGFRGVLVETICIKTSNSIGNNYTKVVSITKNIKIEQQQEYFTDKALPYWVIYRNDVFDKFFGKLLFDVFSCFRDRQITSKNSSHRKSDIRIIKSRNISDDGKTLINIDDYDEYISEKEAKKLSVYSFLNRDDVYLTPNMTYNTRVMKKNKGYLVNGSVAILIPKKRLELSSEDLCFYSSKEYRQFMQIARNYQTRTLNIDSTSVFFFGIRK